MAARGELLPRLLSSAMGSAIPTTGMRLSATASAVIVTARRTRRARGHNRLPHVELWTRRTRLTRSGLPPIPRVSLLLRSRLPPVAGIARRLSSGISRCIGRVVPLLHRGEPPPVVPAILCGSLCPTLRTIAGRWRLCRTSRTAWRRFGWPVGFAPLLVILRARRASRVGRVRVAGPGRVYRRAVVLALGRSVGAGRPPPVLILARCLPVASVGRRRSPSVGWSRLPFRLPKAPP